MGRRSLCRQQQRHCIVVIIIIIIILDYGSKLNGGKQVTNEAQDSESTPLTVVWMRDVIDRETLEHGQQTRDTHILLPKIRELRVAI